MHQAHSQARVNYLFPERIQDDRRNVVYRPATMRDIAIVCRFGRRGLEHAPLKRMVINQKKIYESARFCIEAPKQFCWVAQDRNTREIVACVSAIVSESDWYNGLQASVIQYWSDRPGCGAHLLRIFIEWARSRPSIKMICVMVDHENDPGERIPKLLRRLGLNRAAPAYFMEV